MLLDDGISGAKVKGAGGTRFIACSAPNPDLTELSTELAVAELSNLSLIGLILSILGLPSAFPGTGGGTPKLHALALENRDILEAIDIREYL